MDNKGWGLNTMLAMAAVILIALLVATFFAIRFNAMVGNTNNESEKKVQKAVNEAYYVNKVNELTLAADQYLDDNGIILSSEPFQIGLNTLINYDYIEPIKDYLTESRCQGYANAYLNISGIKIINSYIKCDNYTSKGYGE